MEKKLYYCEYWPKKILFNYSYSISDFIYQKERNQSLFQIHGIILKDNLILTFKKKEIENFENNIRTVIRKFYKDSEIKIWYYREDEKLFDSEHIPSRFAITVQIVEKIKKNDSIFNELERCIVNLIQKLEN